MSKPSVQKNNKTSRKRDTAIIVALIAFLGTIITAISTSPILVAWLQKTPVPSGMVTSFPYTPILPTIYPLGITYSERSDPDTPSASLYTEYSDGTMKLLTQYFSGRNGAFLDAQVSKDCSHVAFSGYEDTNNDGKVDYDDKNQIYVANIDGSDVRRITTIAADTAMPSWSPDGAQLAFRSDRSGSGEVWIVNSDGTELHQVTTSANWAGHVHWSPNGYFIAFYSADENGSYLTVVNPDGSGYRRISQDVGNGWGMYWTRDNRIIFWLGEIDQYYIVNPDGSDLSIFTDDVSWIEDRELCGWPEKAIH